MSSEHEVDFSKLDNLSILADPNSNLGGIHGKENRCDVTSYRSLVGNLLFVANTVRLDKASIVGVLSRYLTKANSRHWDVAVKVFWSIWKVLLCLVQFIESRGNQRFLVMLIEELLWEDRKSPTGYLIKFTGTPIRWNGKKQTSVAQSTTQAEYMFLAETTKALWPLQLFNQSDITIPLTITIHEDNKSTIQLVNHPTQYQRSKHIDIRNPFTRDHVMKT